MIAAVGIWLGPASAAVRPLSPHTELLCDPMADYFLATEDYPEAIRRHIRVLEKHPDNALAHYHLGFAYGMTRQRDLELKHYLEAIELGLSDWELFLNLGLLYLENGHLVPASDALSLATLLGPDHPEPHFNLGVAYEKLGMLAEAEQELLLSLKLNPDQPEAHNTLGVVYAEQGSYDRAREEWSDLVREVPEFQAARANLEILTRAEKLHGGKISRPSNFVTSH